MSSTFYGFEIAKSGLYANQKALDLTSHNIANANTKGYTRQRITSSSIEPIASSSFLAPLTTGSVGGGVNIDSVDQLRNQFLDTQYRNENSTIGEWTIKSDVLSYIEGLFNEPSETGISSALNGFFTGLEELSKNVGSKDVRTNLIEQANYLTETINYYDDQLSQIQKDQEFALTTSVDEVNDIIKNIVSLNDRISQYELGGQKANDLRDRRNLFLDQLSEYTAISYKEEMINNQSILKVNAKIVDSSGKTQEVSIIDNSDYNMFVASKVGTSAFSSIFLESDSPSAIVVDGKNVMEVEAFATGKLKGYMDMRDGDTVTNKGIQYYNDQLDILAKSLVNEFNAVHSAGWSYPDVNNGLASQTGINFFDPANVDASNIKIDDMILANPYNIAGSSGEVVGLSNTGNNENIRDLLALRERKDLPVVYNFEDYMRSYISELGVSTSYANNMVTNQQFLIDNIDNNRASISGVSLDEEMTNMIKYEKSYQASARLITAIDEMLDVLINKTGIVGR